MRRFLVLMIIALGLALGGGLVFPATARGVAPAAVPQSAPDTRFQVAQVVPPAPQRLTAKANGTAVILTWDPVPGAATFSIYRGIKAGGEGAKAYKTGVTTTTFTNTLVTKGTVYYYQVTAVNGSGESPRSNEVNLSPEGVTVTPPPATAPHASTGSFPGWLLGGLLAALLVIGGVFFARRKRSPRVRSAPYPAEPFTGPARSYPPLFADQQRPTQEIQTYADVPLGYPPVFPEDGDADTTTILPPEQRQLAPVGDAPLWPSAPYHARGAEPRGGNSAALIFAIALIALGVIGVGLFAYFALTVNVGNGPNSGVTPLGMPTSTPTLTPTLTPTAPPAPPVAINAGGAPVGNFAGDMDVQGGSTFATTNPIDTSGVNNPAPQQVYQTERYGTFHYTIRQLAPGNMYTVRLHFAEIFFTDPGQRQFNVSINGQRMLTNFDIVAEAGGANRAIVKIFTATADGQGRIIINFTNGDQNNPKVSGIEIAPSA